MKKKKQSDKQLLKDVAKAISDKEAIAFRKQLKEIHKNYTGTFKTTDDDKNNS